MGNSSFSSQRLSFPPISPKHHRLVISPVLVQHPSTELCELTIAAISVTYWQYTV